MTLTKVSPVRLSEYLYASAPAILQARREYLSLLLMAQSHDKRRLPFVWPILAFATL